MTGFHPKNPANPIIFKVKAGASMSCLGAWRGRPRDDMLAVENTGSFS
jgi:hypothetical protein